MHVIETAAKKIVPDVIFYAAAAILVLLAIVILSLDWLTIPYLSGFWKFLLTLVFAGLLANAVIVKRCEANGLKDVRGHLLQIQKSNAKMR